MMGFGALHLTSWIFGAIAVTTIWGGLWWLLSAIGSHPSAEVSPPPPPEEAASNWQQPTYEQPDRTLTSAPLQTRAQPESDYR